MIFHGIDGRNKCLFRGHGHSLFMVLNEKVRTIFILGQFEWEKCEWHGCFQSENIHKMWAVGRSMYENNGQAVRWRFVAAALFRTRVEELRHTWIPSAYPNMLHGVVVCCKLYRSSDICYYVDACKIATLSTEALRACVCVCISTMNYLNCGSPLGYRKRQRQSECHVSCCYQRTTNTHQPSSPLSPGSTFHGGRYFSVVIKRISGVSCWRGLCFHHTVRTHNGKYVVK